MSTHHELHSIWMAVEIEQGRDKRAMHHADMAAWWLMQEGEWHHIKTEDLRSSHDPSSSTTYLDETAIFVATLLGSIAWLGLFTCTNVEPPNPVPS